MVAFTQHRTFFHPTLQSLLALIPYDNAFINKVRPDEYGGNFGRVVVALATFNFVVVDDKKFHTKKLNVGDTVLVYQGRNSIEILKSRLTFQLNLLVLCTRWRFHSCAIFC